MYSAHSTFSASRLGRSGPASRGSGHGVVAHGSIARRFGAQARQAAEAAAGIGRHHSQAEALHPVLHPLGGAALDVRRRVMGLGALLECNAPTRRGRTSVWWGCVLCGRRKTRPKATGPTPPTEPNSVLCSCVLPLRCPNPPTVPLYQPHTLSVFTVRSCLDRWRSSV